MLVQSATSSNFQPRASRIVMATSPPRPPCVGARGGPVCRGQVRGSCPPGATRPSTRSRCRREPRGGSAAAIGRWLARGSAILWRSVQEQSVVPGRPRGRQAHRSRASLLAFFVFVSRGSRLPLNAATLLPSLSLYLSHRQVVYVVRTRIQSACHRRKPSSLCVLLFRFSSVYRPVLCYLELGRKLSRAFGHRPPPTINHHSVLDVRSVNQPRCIYVCSTSAILSNAVSSYRSTSLTPGSHGCSRHLESTTATFMGASCAVKGSKSHPCHCCSHLASPSASVQQQQHHHHRHHHHHHETQHAHQQHHHHHHPAGKQPTGELQPQNNNGDCNILAPLRSKMKVLKKLKRKMGLAPRSSSAGTNNLPPLTFHPVHGENIRLCNGGTIARRYESFCRGITFSARPVRVGEKVCVKFLEISDNWSGVIRFGFTSNDPINLRNGLPRYACPDLTNKPCYWAKAMAERFAERDTVLFYYVTSAGDVHFGVNGEEKGLFFSGVETRGPLWAIIDVYGNSTAIEFVDPNRQHFNNIRRGAEHSNEDNAQHSRHSAMDDASNASRDVERIMPSMQSMSIHHDPDVELPGLRFQPAGVIFTPLPFHPTRGRNIRFSNQQCVATRNDTEFCNGYSFTGRPLLLGERLVVQILATEPMYVGALALGLTSCDPARLTGEDLPDDSDLLLDRPEYWVVSKDVASCPQPGDEIAFTVTHFGEVQMSKNGGPPNVVMHVDQSLQLWAFFDVYGSTQRVRMLAERPTSPPRQRQSNPSPATIIQQQQQQQQQHSNHSNAATELSRFSEMVHFKPAIGGGTVLVVNLPPQTGYIAPSSSTPQPTYVSASHRPQHSHLPAATTASTASTSHPASSRQSSPPLTGTMASTGSSTYVEPVNYQSLDGTLTSQASSHLQQWSEGLQPTPGQPNECSVCYERSVDSVLYMCGHMCMCYPCAIQQWRGKGGGHCPLCRATIRDVIRIYRS